MDVSRPDLRNETNVQLVINALPDHQPGIALDIGAKYGIYTDSLAGKFQQVYAFECDPENMRILRNNVRSSNITLIPEAVGVADYAMIKLYRSNDPGGSSTNEESPRFGGWGHTWDNYIWVSTITLDTIWKNIQSSFVHTTDLKVRFIKCDIEGAEDYVFEYGRKLLQENKLTMVLEGHQPVHYDRLYALFTECGYKVYDVNMNPIDKMWQDCHFIVSNERD